MYSSALSSPGCPTVNYNPQPFLYILIKRSTKNNPRINWMSLLCQNTSDKQHMFRSRFLKVFNSYLVWRDEDVKGKQTRKSSIWNLKVNRQTVVRVDFTQRKSNSLDGTGLFCSQTAAQHWQKCVCVLEDERQTHCIYCVSMSAVMIGFL